MAITRINEHDRLLARRIQQGDAQAIALLYDRYASLVYSIALRVLGDPAPAEQVLTDIFLGIWRDPKCLMQAGGRLAPSMAIIARNRAVAMLLHKPAPDLDFDPSHGITNNRDCEMTPEQAHAAIDKLPVERRLMLERAFFHETAPSASAGETNDVSQLADTGLEVIDLHSDLAFARRQLHFRDVVSHIDGMNRLARVFAESPGDILQELAIAAVDLCGADSAGISVVQKDSTDDDFYHWVATAGQYSGFVNAKLPRYPSACGITLQRGRPQIFRVAQRFFDRMGVQAPIVTDGMLLPWQVDETRGTIWIMAHGRTEAFDGEDCRMMQALANFAATGVRLQQQQKLLIERAETAATAALANTLTHQINNPLQGLMQTVFLFGTGGAESGVFAQQAMSDLVRLSNVVKGLLSFPEE
jgi:DNA-directed RNA polymerase specialized sigma24 family protein